jgi:hypothetical protein
VFKLDCFMLASLTIGWWLKNIDQSNVSVVRRRCLWRYVPPV